MSPEAIAKWGTIYGLTSILEDPLAQTVIIWAFVDLTISVALFWLAYWFVPTYTFAWVPGMAAFCFLLFPIISNRCRGYGWKQSGFEKSKFIPGLKACLRIGLPLIAILYLIGINQPFRLYPRGFYLMVGPWHMRLTSPYQYAFLYLPLALAQEYLFMTFVWDRFRILFKNDHTRAAVWSWLMFVAMHLPNPVLMASSAVGWWIFFCLYYRNRNIIPIAILHAALAILLYKATFSFLPNMMVGRLYHTSYLRFDPLMRTLPFRTP